MTFYLKYRPQKLEELDLVSVRDTLLKIVENKDLPHAFLFAGPKGTGKTSAARILAKVINCEGKRPPCNECDQCLSITKGTNIDVIEMDAASHRGIDDVRELKESIKLSPTLGKKKIYILDEAHMLTTEASNALLKTLEEPPAHVVFILATTNPEKLIETIKSRTTIVAFKKATTEEIKNSLKRVVDGEKIKISDEDLSLIAERSNGAFRDAVKMLEQCSLDSKSFLEGLGGGKEEEFLTFLLDKDKEKSLEIVGSLVNSGVSIENFIKDVLNVLRNKLIKGDSGVLSLMELLLDANSQMSDSPIESLPLEIAIIKYCGDISNNKKEVIVEEKIELKIETKKEEKQEAKVEEKKEEEPKKKVKIEGTKIDDEIWKKILAKVKPINASVEALLRSSHPVGVVDNHFSLGVYYKFHKERLEALQHRKIVEMAIEEVMGMPMRIECILEDGPIKKPALTESKDKDIIKAAEDIFGS